MSESTTLPKLHIGAAYYPEHWPEERWSEDIRLMCEAHLTVVRMGEFAWSALEPVEGEYHFDWLDRAIKLLSDSGIATVLGTPTAAPPAWLVQKYPDSLAVDENGRRVQFGNRCHYCVNSPEFHARVSAIVTAMAQHYGYNPNLIGWQLDNEYNRVCYCPRCQRLFQQYLAEKYGTLEELNARWTTAYWSQTYSAWEQIPIPIGGHNPGLMLEFKRFVTNSYRKFQRLQLDALRPSLSPGIWTTHNFMGWYDGFDHYPINEDLDMASWDWYVGTGHHDYRLTGAIHDLTRGFKRRNFWVMETQPGSVNWRETNTVLDKGEGRAMAWHAVAHGADAVLYWQWRSSLNGQEQYHGTLIDQSGQPRPFYSEVEQLGKEFATVSNLVTGSEVKARVAMLYDYESRWAIQWQRHSQAFDYVEHFNAYYRPLTVRNIPVDILSASSLKDPQQLADYRLVIAPSLLILTDPMVRVLKNYVLGGGNLVLTIRSGMKDTYNALLPERQPGPLSEVVGIEVEEYYALKDPVPVKGNWFQGQSHTWAERLKILNSRYVSDIATYGSANLAANGWLDGQVAISVCSYGSGMAYYVGAYLDEAAQQELVARIVKNAGITVIRTPEGIEMSTRVHPTYGDLYFLINHTNNLQAMWLPWLVKEHLTGQTSLSRVELAPYGVAVVSQEK